MDWDACSLQLPILRCIFKIPRKKRRKSTRQIVKKQHKNWTDNCMPCDNRILVSLPIACRPRVVQKNPPLLLAYPNTCLHLAPKPVSCIKNSLSKPVQLVRKNHPGNLFISNSHLHDRGCEDDSGIYPQIPHDKLCCGHNSICICFLRAVPSHCFV